MENATLFVQFAEIASEEEEWFFIVENLRAAAEALEPRFAEYWRVERERERIREEQGKLLVFKNNNPDPSGIYFMLIAYAIENLCKGLLIKRNRARVWDSAAKAGKLLGDVLGHDVLALLKKIKFPLRPEDEELAFRLERSAVWSARYPVPRKADDKTVKIKIPSGEEVVPTWHREDDLNIVKEFFLRVDDFVTAQLKAHSGEVLSQS